jgi:cell division protease FtsH
VIDTNYQRAENILKENIEILHNMAHALLEWETIDKYQIELLLQGKTIDPPQAEKITAPVPEEVREIGEETHISQNNETELTV